MGNVLGALPGSVRAHIAARGGASPVDDHLAKGREIDEERFLTQALVRTNRALFAKFKYLFRC